MSTGTKHQSTSPLARSLHQAAAALRHSADIIDLAAESPEPAEGREYLRLCVAQAAADLAHLPTARGATRRIA